MTDDRDIKPVLQLPAGQRLMQLYESGWYLGWHVIEDDPDGPGGFSVIRRVSTFPRPAMDGEIATPATPEES